MYLYGIDLGPKSYYIATPLRPKYILHRYIDMDPQGLAEDTNYKSNVLVVRDVEKPPEF